MLEPQTLVLPFGLCAVSNAALLLPPCNGTTMKYGIRPRLDNFLTLRPVYAAPFAHPCSNSVSAIICLRFSGPIHLRWGVQQHHWGVGLPNTGRAFSIRLSESCAVGRTSSIPRAASIRQPAAKLRGYVAMSPVNNPCCLFRPSLSRHTIHSALCLCHIVNRPTAAWHRHIWSVCCCICEGGSTEYTMRGSLPGL